MDYHVVDIVHGTVEQNFNPASEMKAWVEQVTPTIFYEGSLTGEFCACL
jgi:hypothetical protein